MILKKASLPKQAVIPMMMKASYCCIVLLCSVTFLVSGMIATTAQAEDIGHLIHEFHTLLEKQNNNSSKVTEAKQLDSRSRKAFAAGRPEEAKEFLKQAIAILRNNKVPDRQQIIFQQAEPTMNKIITGKGVGTNVHSKSFNSPFGIFGPYEFQLDGLETMTKETVNIHLENLGVQWVQEMPPNIKDVPNTINIYCRVGREGGFKPAGDDLSQYHKALKQFIRANRDRVKYYEADTEPSGFEPPGGWKGHAQQYVSFLKLTYETIKSECSDCQIVLGGIPGIGQTPVENNPHVAFLRSIMAAGADKYFDAFSFKQHHGKADDYLVLREKMEVYGDVLAQYGIDIHSIPVFLETATHDGAPKYSGDHPLSFLDLPPQSEQVQAAALIKTFVYGLALGIDKIFWNEVVERHNFGRSNKNPFNYYGLINHPENDGKSHKKLSYYSYKKLIEILDGSNWNHIMPIEEKNGVFIYKFEKNNTSRKNKTTIWIAWCDKGNQNMKRVISGIDSKNVLLTHAVPGADSGLKVKNYENAFYKKQIKVKGKSITIQPDNIPIFIEELL